MATVHTVLESLEQMHRGPAREWMLEGSPSADRFFVAFLPMWLYAIGYARDVDAHLVLSGHTIYLLGLEARRMRRLLRVWIDSTLCPGTRQFALGIAVAIKHMEHMMRQSRLCYLRTDPGVGRCVRFEMLTRHWTTMTRGQLFFFRGGFCRLGISEGFGLGIEVEIFHVSTLDPKSWEVRSVPRASGTSSSGNYRR